MGSRAQALGDELRFAFAPSERFGWPMHTLIGNLEGVPDDDWDRVPAGGTRSIRAIVYHVGAAYRVYASAALGDGSVGWFHPSVQLGATPADVAGLRRWLVESFEVLAGGIQGLSDAEAARARGLAWGATAPIEDIVRSMVHHTVYHAGEINHVRALLQGTDRWAYES